MSRFGMCGIVVAASLLLGSATARRLDEPDRVGQVVVVGNSDAPAAVILRQFDLRAGEPIRYDTLEGARSRLRGLGFDTESPPTVEVKLDPLNPGHVNVFITVKARRWDWVVFTKDVIAALTTLDIDRLWLVAYRLRLKAAGKAPEGRSFLATDVRPVAQATGLWVTCGITDPREFRWGRPAPRQFGDRALAHCRSIPPLPDHTQ